MQFNEYQTKSRVTARYPEAGNNFIYPILGLTGEAGEVADKVKKLIRDKGVHTPAGVSLEDREEIRKELGDVLWYIAQMATELGLNFDDIAEANITKLYSRLERSQLSGSGDNR